MKKITHWVLGTATARVSGDTARFMNIAVKTGLRPIRSLRRKAASRFGSAACCADRDFCLARRSAWR